jgi:hypothetical protein
MEQSFRRELDQVVSRAALSRLWPRHISLWPSNNRNRHDHTGNLGGLDLPQHMGRYMVQVGDLVAET